MRRDVYTNLRITFWRMSNGDKTFCNQEEGGGKEEACCQKESCNQEESGNQEKSSDQEESSY